MLASVFGKTLYDMRRGLIWWSISLLLMNLWMVSLYPVIQESAEALEQYFSNLPPTFSALVGEAATFSTIEGYLSVELFTFFLPMLTLAFAIVYGAGAIGGEEDSGTLDLLLAHPIPRWRVLAEKFVAVLAFTAVAVLAGYVGIILGAMLVDVKIEPWKVGAATLNLGLLTVLFGTFTLALTGVGLRRGSAAGIGAGLAAITFLMNTLAPIADLPEQFRKVSPWFYYDGGATLREGLKLGNSALLAGLVLVFLLVALYGFQRRDIAV